MIILLHVIHLHRITNRKCVMSRVAARESDQKWQERAAACGCMTSCVPETIQSTC